ncbi:hypothetical protein [Novosphingobium sp. ST904]|uniref:hypothetical protein n=1 Tax=Novosphingobium sp. ST904 TaxID=1684385 RepID=UPI000AE690DA|nr:hypothetical protein [Novosphingobium sp. ST904]
MKKSVMRVLLVATALTALPAVAMAQETPQAGSEQDAPQQGFGDIVVSAQRIDQRLQDVPVSVTAITAEEIETRQVLSPTDIAASPPT